MINIKKIYSIPNHFFEKKIVINGWVKYNRFFKHFGFFQINDGSTINNLQIVYRNNLSNFLDLSKLLPGSAIKIEGILIKKSTNQSKEKINSQTVQKFQRNYLLEIDAKKIEIINATKNDYFLQKKFHTNEFLRTRMDLRGRTSLFSAIYRIRNQLTYQIHNFFQDRDYFQIHSPILTANDCEGGGETFNVNSKLNKDNNFFKNSANLTVSGQLHAEAMSQCLQNVYSFSPVFRADPSNTMVHTPEFWMIEPETAFHKQKDGINLAIDLIKFIVRETFTYCLEDLLLLDKTNKDINLMKRWQDLSDKEFKIISYKEALDILKSEKRFQKDKIAWGIDFNKEHESFLSENFDNTPVFIINYPKEIKPFYMKLNDDNKTVACFDLLLAEIGEIIGGSERESDYDKLIERSADNPILKKNLDWYFDLRKQGFAGSTGFGLGFDRLLMYLTGMKNIRDVIPFYRSPKTLKY